MKANGKTKNKSIFNKNKPYWKAILCYNNEVLHSQKVLSSPILFDRRSLRLSTKQWTIKKQPNLVMHTTPTSYMNITKILQSYDMTLSYLAKINITAT